MFSWYLWFYYSICNLRITTLFMLYSYKRFNKTNFNFNR